MDWLLHLIERAISPIIGAINNVLWNYVLIYGLLAVGIFFTVRLGFVQVRRFPHMLKVIGRGTDGDNAGISPFQALCTSLAARVGTGNLAGVAIAMSLGGPGEAKRSGGGRKREFERSHFDIPSDVRRLATGGRGHRVRPTAQINATGP